MHLSGAFKIFFTFFTNVLNAKKIFCFTFSTKLTLPSSTLFNRTRSWKISVLLLIFFHQVGGFPYKMLRDPYRFLLILFSLCKDSRLVSWSLLLPYHLIWVLRLSRTFYVKYGVSMVLYRSKQVVLKCFKYLLPIRWLCIEFTWFKLNNNSYMNGKGW